MGYYAMTSRPLNEEGRRMLAQRGFDATRYNDTSIFPLQAAQKAEAESVNGGGPQPYRTPSHGSGPGGAAQAYKKAYDQYVADVEKNRSDTLGEYDNRTNKALDMVLGPDVSAPGNPVDRMSYWEAMHPGQKLSMPERMNVAQLYAGLSAEKPRVMENRTDTPPDLSQLIDLEKARGAGDATAGGDQHPVGAPVMAAPMPAGQPQMQQPIGEIAPNMPMYGRPGQRRFTPDGKPILSPAEAAQAQNQKRQAIYGRRPVQPQGQPTQQIPLPGGVSITAGGTSASPTVPQVASLPPAQINIRPNVPSAVGDSMFRSTPVAMQGSVYARPSLAQSGAPAPSYNPDAHEQFPLQPSHPGPATSAEMDAHLSHERQLAYNIEQRRKRLLALK